MSETRPIYSHPDHATLCYGAPYRGDCERCNGDLYEVAFLEPINRNVICPECMRKLMLGALRDWPADELDGFQQPEPASPCDGCGWFQCWCAL